jgi:PAS domain-containing protein
MQASIATADELVAKAVTAARRGQPSLRAALDDLDAPIYVTDPEGVITYFTPACIPFSGRTPVVGADRWCVTWRLYTDDGEYLPHDRCPMAIAIQEKRPVRGVSAVAERPDGGRVNFVPFPTPIFDETGNLCGALNLLVDVTPARQALHLRREAQRCRRLARSVGDQRTIMSLQELAAEYEARAADLDVVR